jgi:hypothetical protein
MVIPAVVNQAWTVGTKGLYWITPRGEDGLSSIQYRGDGSNAVRTIASTGLGVMWGMTASPDGSALLFSLREPARFDLMLVENFR